MNDITIIIISYKSEKIIYDFIKKIPSTIKTIIVENSQNHELKKNIEQNYNNISVYIKENNGVSSALNFAVDKIETKYFLQISPDLEIISDDSLDDEPKIKLVNFLKNWLKDYLFELLGDLLNLTKKGFSNQYSRALIFQLYENNGVVKRDKINHIIKLIPLEERKKLWSAGIKIGRYHIYLPRMFKPKAVKFRVSLWELYYNLNKKNDVPKFGLNFLINNNFDKNFMLFCGFENFGNYFVRIDILEKLFIKILEKTAHRKFKIDSEMMNLLGCSKDDFHKLMDKMNYKKDKEKDVYIFLGESRKKNKIKKILNNSSPFKKLLDLNIK